jgi:hypothetical protein
MKSGSISRCSTPSRRSSSRWHAISWRRRSVICCNASARQRLASNIPGPRGSGSAASPRKQRGGAFKADHHGAPDGGSAHPRSTPLPPGPLLRFNKPGGISHTSGVIALGEIEPCQARRPTSELPHPRSRLTIIFLNEMPSVRITTAHFTQSFAVTLR